MSKIDKKKLRIHDQIISLEQHLKDSLHRKSSSEKEVNVPKIMREIADLKAQLQGA